MTTQKYVRNSLRTLPDTLTAAYEEIYQQILWQRGSGPRLALNAFRWIQCSYEPLAAKTLLDAITVEVSDSGEFSHDVAVQANDLLKACHNLVIWDGSLHVFRLAHPSVGDYLESKLNIVDSHTELAKVCLSLVCTSSAWGDCDEETTEPTQYKNRHLLSYAATFWPWHLFHARYENCQTLTVLWDTFASGPIYQHWLEYCRRAMKGRHAYSSDCFWRRWQALQEGAQDLLTCVCVFGLASELRKVFKSQLEPTCIDKLLLLSCKFGDLEVVRLLIDRRANVWADDSKGKTALHIASQQGHEYIVRLLLDRGADVSAIDREGKTALHIASQQGYEDIVRLLLDWGADVSAIDREGKTVLHIASRQGCSVPHRPVRPSWASDGTT